MSNTKAKAEVENAVLRKILSKLLIVVIVSIIAIILALNIRQLIVCAIVKTDMLRPAGTKQTASVEIILIKEEKVVTAPAGGQVNMLCEPGKRVRAGEKIAEITSGDGVGSTAVYSAAAGLLQEIDGLESILTKGMVGIIDVSALVSNTIALQNDANYDTGSGVSKGQPFCKIVDNLKPVNCIAWAKDDEKIFSETGKNVTIIGEGYSIQAEIKENEGADGMALLDVTDYPTAFALERRAEAEVVTGETSGLLVHEGALVAREDEQGLFVVRGLKVAWEPVTVLDKTDEGSIVWGELLTENDLYVVNPFLVREGDRV